MLHWEVSNIGKDCACFIPVVLGGEPAWGLGTEEHADEQEGGADALAGEWDHPGCHGLGVN